MTQNVTDPKGTLGNLLLQSLPPDYYAGLHKKLEAIALPVPTPLFDGQTTPRWAYFITSGIASVVDSSADGRSTEVGMVGCEGITGWNRLLGPLSLPVRCFIQVAGTGLRIPFSELRKEFENDVRMRKSVLAYVQHEAHTATQLAACNSRHNVSQRLARWLLMCQDRMATEQISLTQEFLAEMLGVRRSSVALSASNLQDRGLIAYKRGTISILDRTGLEDAACSCYGVISQLREMLYR
jgi:CRP-like cAMP-binding protein